jgi:hypothetical protein
VWQRVPQAQDSVVRFTQRSQAAKTGYVKPGSDPRCGCVLGSLVNHERTQIDTSDLEPVLCQGDGVVPRAARSIQHGLHPIFFKKAQKKGQLVCEPPFPIHKAIIVVC